MSLRHHPLQTSYEKSGLPTATLLLFLVSMNDCYMIGSGYLLQHNIYPGQVVKDQASFFNSYYLS